MAGNSELGLKEGLDFRVKRGHWLPKKVKVDCIAFGSTMYLRDSEGGIPNHEYMHLLQFRRHGTMGVVAHYFIHLLRNYLTYRNFGEAFRRIPFEVEAKNFEAQQGRYRQ